MRGVRNVVDQLLIFLYRRHQIERVGPYAVRQQCFRGKCFGRDLAEGIPSPKPATVKNYDDGEDFLDDGE